MSVAARMGVEATQVNCEFHLSQASRGVVTPDPFQYLQTSSCVDRPLRVTLPVCFSSTFHTKDEGCRPQPRSCHRTNGEALKAQPSQSSRPPPPALPSKAPGQVSLAICWGRLTGPGCLL